MRSSDLFRESSDLFPGGVNSPVRYYKPFPVSVKSGHGSRIIDQDGNEYVDYCLGFGPMILGHNNSVVNEKLFKQIREGFLFGTLNENEVALGKMIKSAVPSIEKMRFTNSGTEATMHAIRLARGYTGRDLIVKMQGGFHGAHDYSLIKSGSGTLTFGVPSSPGIPEEVTKTVLLGDYNNPNSIRQLFKDFGNRIAAVITEPIMGNAGVINPEKGFLELLRETTEEYGSLLIFDEVITGFRFAFSAYQDLIGVRPDLTTMGKIIGGGLPIGLFGGRSEIMSEISPSGPVYEAGTFSGNALSMASGIATLEILKKSDYTSLNRTSDKIISEIEDILNNEGVNATVNHYGSMFQIFFNKGKVVDYASSLKSDKEFFFSFFRSLLKLGIYLPPSQFETNFISFAHSADDLDKTLKAIEEALNDVKNKLRD